jgi:hypothetical protein
VLIPVALAAIAWAALAVMLPPAKLRALVQKQLGSTLSREVRFADVRLGLWPPVRVSVKEPALAEPGGFARGAAFRARSLNLDLDVLALLVRRLVVRRLELDRPAIHVVLRADGTTNLDRLGAPPSQPGRPGAAMDFAVSRLDVRDGAVLIDDFAAGRRTSFGCGTSMSCALEARTGRIRTEGESKISELRFGPLSATRASDLNASLARVEWKIGHRAAFDLGAKRLAIERLSLVFGRTELAFAGTVDAAGRRPLLDLRARGSGVDLSEVLRYLSAADARALNGIRGAGRLDFDLGVRGALDPKQRPALTGTLGVRDGEFGYPGIPVGIEATSFTARFAPDSLLVRELKARVSGQPVRGELEATRLSDPLLRFGLAGTLDLAAVSRFIAPQDTRIEGKAALDVSGRGRAKDPGSMALAGWVKLANASVLNPKLPKPVERINGELRFTPARVTVNRLSGEAGKSSFVLDASATRPLALLAKQSAAGPPVAPADIDFTLRSPYLDLAELLPPTPGGPLLPNARGQGNVSIGRLRNRRLDVQNVTARVQLEPTVVSVPRFTLSGYGGAAHGEARFSLENPAKPRVAMKATVDSAKADAFLSAWTGAGELLHGVLGTTIDLSTEGITEADVRRSITATGLAKIVNGTLGPAPLFEAIASFTRIPAYREVKFRDFTTPFRVENGRVATGPARLEGSYGEWLLSGVVGFDGSLDYFASITVPPELVSRLGAAGALAAGALSDPKGRVLLDLHITGNARSPRVAWDTRAMRDRLLGRAPPSFLPPQANLALKPGDTLDAAGRVAQDSARVEAKRVQRALEDSLKRAAQGLLKGLFGGGKRDTGK